MPVAEIYGGISAFKAMFDMAKGLKDLSNASDRNAAVIELQEKIFTAQQVHSALLERVGALEKRVAGFETWDAEKQRYELKEIAPGVVVRSLKSDMSNGEPPHFICANCYNRGEKQHPQKTLTGSTRDEYTCSKCGDVLRLPKQSGRGPTFARGSGGPNSWMGQ